MKKLWKIVFVVLCVSVIISLPQHLSAQKADESKESSEKLCPMCKSPMGKDAPSIEFKGKTYYFCCEECRRQFEKDPDKYGLGSKFWHKKVYVCPMESCNYKAAAPGKCPKCGMELQEAYVKGDFQEGKHMHTMCPVCKSQIAKGAADIQAKYNDKTYYFCCDKCKASFEKNPAEYTPCKEHMHRMGYVCPMKGCDYKADKQDKCPRCGAELKKTIECCAAKTKQKTDQETEQKESGKEKTESDIHQ